ASGSTAGARGTFPDWRFAPNIGGHPDVYEAENQALDRAGHVLAAMRRLAPWSGRTVIDLGCGTGYWMPGYARDAREVIGIEPDPALRAAAAARTGGLSGVEVSPARPSTWARRTELLAAASPQPAQYAAATVDAWWQKRGASRQEVRSEWRFPSRADLEAVLRIEFPDQVTDTWLARHPRAIGLTYGYVLFSVIA